MAKLEESSRKKSRKSGLRRAILQTVAAAGLVSLAVMAPNTPKVIPRAWLRSIFDRPRTSRNVAITKLVTEGMLVREKRNGVSVLRITPKGRGYLSRTERRFTIARPKKWDGKWRVVMFDIKEPRRNVRDALRRELRTVGFHKLQDSVWVFPYPCEEYIALLKADMHIGKDVLYLIADEVENENVLREVFKITRR